MSGYTDTITVTVTTSPQGAMSTSVRASAGLTPDDVGVLLGEALRDLTRGLNQPTFEGD